MKDRDPSGGCKRRAQRFMLCVRKRGYAAGVEVRKVYLVLPDRLAERRGLVRVVDESGEDYLYPATFFAEVEIPRAALRVLTRKKSA